MGENKTELRDIYEDAIIIGGMKDSIPANRQKAKHTFNKQSWSINTDLCVRNAKSLARKKEIDETVAGAIAMALMYSTIVYGETGESFLQKKAEEAGESFSRYEYSDYIVEQMLSGYDGRKKNSIIQGISDAMNDRSNPAADAAKAAILIQEYWSRLQMKKGDAVEKEFAAGSLIAYDTIQQVLCEAAFGKFSQKEAEEKLDILYKALSQKIEIVKEDSVGEYEGFSDTKKLIYYLADFCISEVDRFLTYAYPMISQGEQPEEDHF